MSRMICTLVVVFLVWSSISARADAANTRLDQGSGVLAVSEDGAATGSWRITGPGDVLPQDCLLRTAADGPCLIRLPEGTLHLGANSQARWDFSARQVTIHWGRALLSTGHQSGWSLAADTLLATPAANSVVEATVDSSSAPALALMAGSVRVSSADGDIQDFTGPATITLDAQRGALSSRPLAQTDRERIAAWTAVCRQSQGLGQLMIKDAQSDSPVRLNVARYHVHVVIQPPVALVQIDQSFYNPFNSQREGQFVFNLPHGASVSRFAMYVTPTELIEGELIERQQASQIYQTIVNRRRDPAILEQIGDNLFKMRVFPIFARDEKRILLDYTLPLESVAGKCQFRLPLLSDLEPVWDFRITGTIRGAIPKASITSASHPNLIFQDREDGSVRLAFHKQNYQPETDLVLSFAKQADRPPALRSYVVKPVSKQRNKRGKKAKKREMYFLAEVPPLPSAAEPPPVDVLLVADTSSSVKDLQPVRRAVHQVVRSLRPEDRVRLVCADVAVRPLHEGWLTPQGPDANRLAQALRSLDQEFSLGGTDLDSCLREAVQAFEDQANRRRLVIYVGDGGDQFGQAQRILPDWLKETGAVLVGLAVQRAEHPVADLKSLASASGGLWFDLTGDVRGQRALFQWLLAGLPSPEMVQQVTIGGAKSDDLYWPAAWIPGEPLFVYGRMSQSQQVKLAIRLGRGSNAVTKHWILSNTEQADDVFVGRLWAQRRLEQLRRLDPDKKDVREQIIALSQEWSLLSPHTAFLVLESESDYERWNIDRLVRHRYWKPADSLTTEPLPRDWLAAVTPSRQPRTSDDEFQEALETAGKALEKDDLSKASRLLRGVASSRQAVASKEYAQLERQVRERQRSQALEQSQKSPHRLLDLGLLRARWDLRPSVLPLVGSTFRASPEFLRRHPHAEALLKEISPSSLADGRTLEQLALTLAELTGANVALDRRALDDVGISVDTRIGREPRRADSMDPFGAGAPAAPVNPFGGDDPFADNPPRAQAVRTTAPEVQPDGRSVGRLSLRSCVRHLLRPLELVLIEEPHRLLITTPEEAEGRLTTEVYPVADLLYTDRVAPLASLNDPYMDRLETARKRINAKLKRTTTLEYMEAPLEEVAANLSELLNDVVLLDERALDDVGIGTDTPITAMYRDVPAKEALRWVLDDLELTFAIQDEALVITTPEEVEDRMEVRLHSGRGVLYEFPADTWPATRPPWFGSPMMGFGGGAMGGGMGMGGMGMGAGGAARAGFGGGMGGMASGAAGAISGSGIGLSSGGDAGQGTVSGGESPASSESDIVADAATSEVSEQQYSYDTDSIIDLVTTTIEPQGWDEVGGPGSVEFFPNTLDFVFAQTARVHDEVEALFERLKSMPPQVGDKLNARPATVHSFTQDSPGLADFDTLIDLISCTVGPQTWDTVGGPGSIEAEVVRMALIVSHTADMHGAVSRLLTLFRRSRYESVHRSRPWETAMLGMARRVDGAPSIPDLYTSGLLSELPQPEPKELNLLGVRHDPAAGRWRWRRTGSDGTQEEFSIHRAGSRLECRLPHCTLRTEGDRTAIGWTGLELVEHSVGAEAFRQILDIQLPWLPHRTNREIARLFEVTADAPANEVPKRDEDLVWLRLKPNGVPPGAGTYLQIGYAKNDGQATAWEAYVDSNLTARVRFADRSDNGPLPEFRVAVLEDGEGRELARWELVGSDVNVAQISELTTGWDGYLHLDLRAQEATLDAPLAESLAAMRQFDWNEAAQRLNRLPEDRAAHPLVRLLDAWIQENDPRLGSAEHKLAQLSEVMQSGLPDVVRCVSQDAFPSLSDEQLYALLVLRPEAERSGEDCRRLAQVAAALDEREDALRHAERASALGVDADHKTALERMRVELLLGLGLAAHATAAAEAWASGESTGPDDLAAMAEILARYAQREPAERLFRAALANDELAPTARYRLLLRWSVARQGVGRCEKLLEAAELHPSDSRQRRDCLRALRTELKTTAHAATAGQLASMTEDAELTAELHLRQAELTSDAKLAADLAWKVYESGRLGDGRLGWATRVWNRAEEASRVIQACEQLLREGRTLPPAIAEQLVRAYRDAGRNKEADRAASREDTTLDPLSTQQPRPTGGFF